MRPRTAAPQPVAAARAHRRRGHRRHHADRRPGPDHRPYGGAACRTAPIGARFRDRPDVRRRHDCGDDDGRRHRLRRVRRGGGRRRGAHGEPPDGPGRGPEPAVCQRAPGGPRRTEHGQHCGEPARPLSRHHQGTRRCLRRGQPGQVAAAYQDGKIQPDLVPVTGRKPAKVVAAQRRRAAASGHHPSRTWPGCAPRSARTAASPPAMPPA